MSTVKNKRLPIVLCGRTVVCRDICLTMSVFFNHLLQPQAVAIILCEQNLCKYYIIYASYKSHYAQFSPPNKRIFIYCIFDYAHSLISLHIYYF